MRKVDGDSQAAMSHYCEQSALAWSVGEELDMDLEYVCEEPEFADHEYEVLRYMDEQEAVNAAPEEG